MNIHSTRDCDTWRELIVTEARMRERSLRTTKQPLTCKGQLNRTYRIPADRAFVATRRSTSAAGVGQWWGDTRLRNHNYHLKDDEQSLADIRNETGSWDAFNGYVGAITHEKMRGEDDDADGATLAPEVARHIKCENDHFRTNDPTKTQLITNDDGTPIPPQQSFRHTRYTPGHTRHTDGRLAIASISSTRTQEGRDQERARARQGEGVGLKSIVRRGLRVGETGGRTRAQFEAEWRAREATESTSSLRASQRQYRWRASSFARLGYDNAVDGCRSYYPVPPQRALPAAALTATTPLSRPATTPGRQQGLGQRQSAQQQRAQQQQPHGFGFATFGPSAVNGGGSAGWYDEQRAWPGYAPASTLRVYTQRRG